MLAELKSGPCADCGQTFPPYVMDFDHKDWTDKEAEVAAIKFGRWELVLAEVAKCDLVCSNCHRIRTHHRGYRGRVKAS